MKINKQNSLIIPFLKGDENKGFTLVELIVVITILAILGTIAFISLRGFSRDARNSTRATDMQSIKKVLSLYQLRTGEFPAPTDGEEVTYSGSEVWTEGTFGKDTRRLLGTRGQISQTPVDPLSGNEYTYSVLNTKKEYQISGVFEGNVSLNTTNKTYAAGTYGMTKISGNYNGQVAKTQTGGKIYVLAVPSIVSGGNVTSNDVVDIINAKKLVYNKSHILPKSYSGATAFQETLPTKNIVNTGSLVVYETNDINSLKQELNQQTLIDNLKQAYSGTTVSSNPSISSIVNAASSNELPLAQTIINNNLNSNIVVSNTPSTPSNSCASQPSYIYATFTTGAPTQANQAWQNTDSNAPCYYTCTDGYSGNDCATAPDTTPPTGGSFTVPATSSSTGVTLTITCPAETGVQMYISGDITETPTWEPCTSSKAVTLTTGNGTKNISMKFRDSVGNESEVNNENSLLSIVLNYCAPGTFKHFNENQCRTSIVTGLKWVEISTSMSANSWKNACNSIGKAPYMNRYYPSGNISPYQTFGFYAGGSGYSSDKFWGGPNPSNSVPKEIPSPGTNKDYLMMMDFGCSPPSGTVIYLNDNNIWTSLGNQCQNTWASAWDGTVNGNTIITWNRTPGSTGLYAPCY